MRNCERNDLIGNWYLFNADIGYSELTIDTHEISIFSHYMGNLGIQSYSYDNDSLHYIHLGYSVGVKILSDTTIVLSIKSMSDTLFALPKDILTYDKTHYQNDSLFALFYREFELRARNAGNRNGYGNFEDYDKSIIDLIEIEEEILINRIKN